MCGSHLQMTSCWINDSFTNTTLCCVLNIEKWNPCVLQNRRMIYTVNVFIVTLVDYQSLAMQREILFLIFMLICYFLAESCRWNSRHSSHNRGSKITAEDQFKAVLDWHSLFGKLLLHE